MLVEKIYYIANSDELERALEILSIAGFCMTVVREFIEMDYSKVTVTCLETQVSGVEHILAKAV